MKKNRLRSLSSQSVMLAGASAGGQLLVALVFLLAARGTDPGSLGHVVSMIAIGVTLAGVMDFGSNTRIARDIARRDVPYSDIRNQLTTKLLIFTLACLIFVSVISFAFPETDAWICFLLAYSTLMGQTLQSALRGLGRAHVVGVAMIADRTVVLVSFVLLTGAGITSASCLWISLILGPVIASTFTLAVTPRKLRPTLLRWKPSNPWTRSINFGASGVFISLQSMDVSLLQVIGGAPAAGLYGAVNKWTQPISIVAGAFASASAPFVARAGNISHAWHGMRRAIWMPASAVAIAIIMAIFAPVMVPVLIGDEYGQSGSILTILALAAIPGVLNQTFFVSLQSLGRDQQAAVVLAIIVIIQLLFIVIFGAAYGAIACAVAALVSQFLQLFCFSYLIRSEFKKTEVE